MNDKVALMQLQGNVKIETFDAKTGEKQDETEGHNIFTDYGLERFRKYCVVALGGQMRRNLYCKENTSTDVYHLVDSSSWGLLKYLILTDNTAAISASDRRIPGTCTGYAGRSTATSTSTKWGIYNLSESFVGRNGMKFVADFGTDKANATHKSIFWSDNSPGSYSGYQGYEYVYDISPTRTYTQMAEASDGYFYGSYGSTLYKIDPVTLEEIESYALPHSPATASIFDVVGGVCYYATSESSDELYIYNLALGTETTFSIYSSYSPQARRHGCVVGDYLYCTEYEYRLQRYCLSTGEKENVSYSMSSYGGVLRQGTQLYLIDGHDVYTYDWDTATAIYIGTITGCFTVYNSSSTTENMLAQRSISSYYEDDLYKNNTILRKNLYEDYANMITGKKLSSPVTKTSDQTMKVTYTISWS